MFEKRGGGKGSISEYFELRGGGGSQPIFLPAKGEKEGRKRRKKGGS